MFWLAVPAILYAANEFLKDDSSSSRSTNSSSVKREYKEDKKEQLQDDINEYKDKQIAFIKQKYNADISINNAVVKINQTDNKLKKHIKKSSSDIKEIESVVLLLKEAKDATLS